MARKTDRSVARNHSFQREGVGIRERHNERKNEMYSNPDVVMERTHMNVHYKECTGTYNQWLDKNIEEGTVSMRGLKPDAKVFGELVFDVNTMYFENHGGYEFAKQFYEEAFRYAEKKIGSDYIISAMMHADEVHRGILDDTGQAVYHYHLHVMYVPVVQKEIKWSKRCKDKSLVGTTKEVINQISNSKKWAFPQAIDDNGDPVFDKNGKPVLIPSYRILQTEFYEHMVAAGFDGFERGELGSDAQHLSVVEYKVQQSKEKLTVIEGSLADKENTLEDLTAKVEDFEQIEARADELHKMARQNEKGLVEMPWSSFDKLYNLAKEGLYSRTKIQILKSQIVDLTEKLELVMGKFGELYEQTKKYIAAMRFAPEHLKGFISKILDANRIKSAIMLNTSMPPLFQGRKNKKLPDMNRNRGYER
jgi:chemotaxis protein histidine kinase CheA